MERLRPREGIVRTRLIETNLLIPTRPAAEACRTVQPLNLFTVLVWSGLEKGSPREELRRALQILIKKPDPEVDAMLDQIVQDLREKGFLAEPSSPAYASSIATTPSPATPPFPAVGAVIGRPAEERDLADHRDERSTALRRSPSPARRGGLEEAASSPADAPSPATSLPPVESALLGLVRGALAGEAPADPGLNGEQWEALLDLADGHKLMPLVLDAAFRLPSLRGGLDREALKAWRRRALDQLARQVVQENEFLNLMLALKAQGLEPLVLKGPVCRSLYPKPLLRPSVDDDLLIDPAQASTYHRALLELGMDPDEGETPSDSAWELAYHKPDSPLYLELHKCLFDPEGPVFSAFNGWFEGAADRAVPVQLQDVTLKTLCPTDQLCFLILHAFKHFLYSGFGLRIVADVCLFARTWAQDLDFQAIDRVCEALRCGGFVRAVFQIGEKHLGIPAPAGFGAPAQALEPLLADILDAGLHGAQVDRLHSANITLRAAALRRRDSGAGLKTSLFPSAQALSGRYPFLVRRPWLLPLAWLRRLAAYALGPKTSAAASLRIGQARLALLEQYGVIDKAFPKPSPLGKVARRSRDG